MANAAAPNRRQMTFEIRHDEDGLRFDVLVQPRASRARIGPIHGDRLKVAITAPPVDGAANEAVTKLLAKSLGCPRASVAIVRGTSSRRKTIHVRGVTETAVRELIAT